MKEFSIWNVTNMFNIEYVHLLMQKQPRESSVFIFSHFRTEYVDPGGAPSVRQYVCVSVCVSVTASHFHNSWPILMKLGPHDLNKNLR